MHLNLPNISILRMKTNPVMTEIKAIYKNINELTRNRAASNTRYRTGKSLKIVNNLMWRKGLMNTYFCIICGSSDLSLQVKRCPVCGGDKREFILVNSNVKNNKKNTKNNLSQKLLSMRLSKYL